MRKPSTDSSKIASDKKIAELKAKAEIILSQARRRLLNAQPFIGTIAMGLNIKPVRDDRISTAMTDGNSIYFDIDFLSRLTDDERVFVIAHEVWHNVYCHFLRTEGRDRELFNIATDVEINEMLVGEGFCVPKDALRASSIGSPIGLSAEEYYEILIQKRKSNSLFMQSLMDSLNNSGEGCDGRFDKHIYMNDDFKNDPGNPDVDDKYGKVGRDPDLNDVKVDEHTIEKIREAAVYAAQVIEKSGGSLPAGAQKLINDLLKPQVPWQELLCQFITKCYGMKVDWNRPNRRFVHQGTYLPSRYGDSINVVVGIDTSASVDQHLPKFLGELNGLLKSFDGYRLTVIEADYNVKHTATYSEDEPLDLENVKYTTHGGGGTEMKSILEYVKDNSIDADAIVMFTDGENSSTIGVESDPGIPLLWMITENGTDKYINIGEVIKL